MTAATSPRHKQRNGVFKDAPGHVAKTLGATVTEKPSRPEMAVDLVLVAAGAVEAISPPAAIVGLVMNRLLHVAK